MDTMNIALPPEMKEFVRDEVNGGGYSSLSEYIRDLIRREQMRKAEARLEALLLEALDSGPSSEMTSRDWEEMREGFKRRWAEKMKSK
jgi:antitoxin ParD1/3/4